MGSAFFGSGRNDCEQVEERLEAYITGALSEGEERNRITAHLSDCPECRARVVGYTRVGEALSSYRAAPLPERTGDWRTVRVRLETASERRLGWGRPVFGGRAIVTGIAAAMLGFTAVAFPRLHESPNEPVAPEAAPTPAPRESSAIPHGESGSVSRLMGYVTVGKGENTLSAAPSFVGTATGAVVPLAIEVGSNQAVPEARLEVRPQRVMDGRLYRYDVRLEKGTSRFLVYPSFNPTSTASGLIALCEVTLTAPGRSETVRLHVPTNGGQWSAIAYVGDRPGVISPRSIPRGENKTPRQPNIRPNYVAVENAPDRTDGYNRFSMVVLSPEAAQLNPTQWRAIREWVTMGGHLMLTSDRLLDVPIGAELSPVRKVVRKAFGTSFVPIKGASEKEARLPYALSGSPATITWRKWGVGTVSFTAFDPAAKAFRDWDGCDTFWENMLATTRSWSPDMYRTAAHLREVSLTSAAPPALKNPFALTLPSVHFVVFLFLGYFVLVVPVTFVVLKHTRRLNLAWVTGPALAAVFAGGIFLLTARLYFMPTTRRTAGVIFLHSGERAGRFVGNTELFFPKAGRYDLPIPQADTLETTLFTEDRERLMESRSNRTGETTATLSVGNLAFRRLYHTQSVDLPGAVTVEVQPDGKGELVGYVENNTGKPLRNAVLSSKITVERKTRRYQGYFEDKVHFYQLGTLPVGRTAVHTRAKGWVPAEYANANYLSYSVRPSNSSGMYPASERYYGTPMPQHLTLMAHIPGETFGPRIGQDVSGEQSVSVVVGVTAQKTGGK